LTALAGERGFLYAAGRIPGAVSSGQDLEAMMAKAAKPTKPAVKKAVGSAPPAPRMNGGAKQEPTATLSAPPAAAGAQPSLKVLGQYTKDFSFENPNAPQSLAPQNKQPDINIAVNVNAKNLAPNDFEVELHLDAKAASEGKVLFAAELVYAGIFRMENFPENVLHAAVLIECPRMLFPFARQIMADATRNGGFPPLMLDPIDFANMYQRRMAQQQAQQSQQA
jgi:preprotein translocase subunit SecB